MLELVMDLNPDGARLGPSMGEGKVMVVDRFHQVHFLFKPIHVQDGNLQSALVAGLVFVGQEPLAIHQNLRLLADFDDRVGDDGDLRRREPFRVIEQDDRGVFWGY